MLVRECVCKLMEKVIFESEIKSLLKSSSFSLLLIDFIQGIRGDVKIHWLQPFFSAAS